MAFLFYLNGNRWVLGIPLTSKNKNNGNIRTIAVIGA
jgi:hypothetical protein